MAIASEIIFLIIGMAIILFIAFFLMLRLSNKIVSRKLDESGQRINHLEKIAKHHSKLLTLDNMNLKHRLQELEKHVEKAERMDETEQIVAKAIEKLNKKH